MPAAAGRMPALPNVTRVSVARRSYRTVEGEREHVARLSRHIAGLAPDNRSLIVK